MAAGPRARFFMPFDVFNLMNFAFKFVRWRVFILDSYYIRVSYYILPYVEISQNILQIYVDHVS